MQTLVIDCGNSRVKLALFKEEELVHLETVNNPASNDLTPVHTAITKLMTLAPESNPIRCVMSSVAASLTSPMLALLQTEFKIEPTLVTSSANHGLTITYNPPESLGADRIADSAAATHLFGAPCITVNFGTATTFNVIVPHENQQPCFIGGVICAGLEMTLASFAAKLPNLGPIDLIAPPSIIGQSTQNAMSSGLLYGHAAMVDGLIEKIQTERNIAGCPVLATGGHASTIAPHCRKLTQVDPNLTLLGILMISRNQ